VIDNAEIPGSNRALVADDVDQERVIDATLVAEILAGGGYEEGLLDLFVTRTRGRLTDLADAVKAGDAADAARIVHSLRGSSATFGASELANAAARLSGLRGQELLSQAESSAQALRASFAKTERAFEAVVAGLAKRPWDSAGGPAMPGS
jgi:HPt (histidine-containing phosphotransfer) domain-containing protein